MWKKIRIVALIGTVLTPIACIHTCWCCGDNLDLESLDLSSLDLDSLYSEKYYYKDGKGVVREVDPSIEAESAAPAEKQSTP